jgi:hypothetical protein
MIRYRIIGTIFERLARNPYPPTRLRVTLRTPNIIPMIAPIILRVQAHRLPVQRPYAKMKENIPSPMTTKSNRNRSVTRAPPIKAPASTARISSTAPIAMSPRPLMI